MSGTPTQKLPTAKVKLTCYNRDIYEPSDDSFLLVDALLQVAEGWRGNVPRLCLEIGCGSGYVITSLALMLAALGGANNSSGSGTAKTTDNGTAGAAAAAAAHSNAAAPTLAAAAAAAAAVGGERGLGCRGGGSEAVGGGAAQCIATDLNPAAVAATQQTLAQHGVLGGVDVLRCDLAEPLRGRLKGCVDVLVFNPPYVPTPDDEVEATGAIAAAWAGGDRGRRVTDRLLPTVGSLLSPRGEFFLVVVPENNPEEIKDILAQQGLQGSTLITRAADEELLSVLHFTRRQEEPTAAAAAAAVDGSGFDGGDGAAEGCSVTRRN